MSLKVKNKQPVIGVTGPVKGGKAAWMFTRFSIWMAGGKAKLITANDPCNIDELDGLIIGGGSDIDPEHYGEKRSELLFEEEDKKGKSWKEWVEFFISLLLYPIFFFIRKYYSSRFSTIDKERDNMEFELLKKAVEKELPVLGICRGMQLINIHFKGSLYQDVKHFYVESPQLHTIFPKKRVYIAPNTCLSKTVGTNSCKVNALHNQAIKETGKNLIEAAKETTGITQAIEHVHFPFLIGVQWHPEYLPQLSEQRNIFRKLVKAATHTSNYGNTPWSK